MGAKLLYGEINALANMHGYSWASNQYFADLYEVDERTIKRWLKSLSDNNFIKIETDKTGIQWQRKIWISHDVQKMFTKGHFCHPPRTFLSPPPSTEHHIVSINNTKNNTPIAPKGDVCVAFGDFVKLSQEDYDGFVAKYGKQYADDLIESINDHIASKGLKPYKDYAATMRNWIKRKQEQGGSKAKAPDVVQKNYDFAKTVVEKFAHMTRSKEEMELGPTYFELGKYPAQELIEFKEKAFRERVVSKLRKMGYPVEGL